MNLSKKLQGVHGTTTSGGNGLTRQPYTAGWHSRLRTPSPPRSMRRATPKCSLSPRRERMHSPRRRQPAQGAAFRRPRSPPPANDEPMEQAPDIPPWLVQEGPRRQWSCEVAIKPGPMCKTDYFDLAHSLSDYFVHDRKDFATRRGDTLIVHGYSILFVRRLDDELCRRAEGLAAGHRQQGVAGPRAPRPQAGVIDDDTVPADVSSCPRAEPGAQSSSPVACSGIGSPMAHFSRRGPLLFSESFESARSASSAASSQARWPSEEGAADDHPEWHAAPRSADAAADSFGRAAQRTDPFDLDGIRPQPIPVPLPHELILSSEPLESAASGSPCQGAGSSGLSLPG